MTEQDLRTLLDYHYWARDRLLEALEPLTPDQFTRDMGSSFKSIRDTVAHIYAAEWAWHSRWQGVSPAALLSPDLFPDLAAIRAQWTELEAKMRSFVNGMTEADVTRPIDNKLLNGSPGSSPIGQMLPHVVNHASYHRGQVTTMLRQLGVQPPKPMDMIAYYRVTGKS